jgi:hypothetical protein
VRRRTPEERYKYNVRRQDKTLAEFAEHETEWADILMAWYRRKKLDMPDDEYRACAFFLNREFLNKPGSLTLLYKMYLRLWEELPEYTKEHGFDLLRFRYKSYAKVLTVGGFS